MSFRDDQTFHDSTSPPFATSAQILENPKNRMALTHCDAECFIKQVFQTTDGPPGMSWDPYL